MKLEYKIDDTVIVIDSDKERLGTIVEVDESNEYPYKVYFLAGYTNRYSESEIKCKYDK